MTHGGKRPGSGRKKKDPTKTISFRENTQLIMRLKLRYGKSLNGKISAFLKSLDDAIHIHD